MAGAGAAPAAGPRRWVRSLRFRLLAATLVAVAAALLLAGLLLSRLVNEHVLRQFGSSLTAQLDQVTAGFDIGATGQPQLDERGLLDPRWQRPYGGLYWQVDGPQASGVLRSRSLWDATLAAPDDALPDGTVHQHRILGPDGAPLLLVERGVRAGAADGAVWRLIVAADLAETEAAVAEFNGLLAGALALLGVLLVAAALAQVGVGLAPLKALQRGLADVHEGRSERLQGQFPAEVQPLIDDFNAVIDRHAEVVARARTQAGNLAHAIKTPLAALAQGAQAAGQAAQRDAALEQLPVLVREQVAMARRQVDWHLARARAAAATGLPGARVPVAPVVAGLLRVLARAHAERALALSSEGIPPELAFAGEAQDLQEMLGNLLDNACKWARREVRVSATLQPGPRGRSLQLVVEDDGPGIAAGQQTMVLARGARLDEQVPGSGLGLAIVHDLVGLYHGQLSLGTSPLGGLRATLVLPAAVAGA